MTNCSLVLKEQSFLHEYDCQYKPKLLAVATSLTLMMNGAYAGELNGELNLANGNLEGNSLISIDSVDHFVPMMSFFDLSNQQKEFVPNKVFDLNENEHDEFIIRNKYMYLVSDKDEILSKNELILDGNYWDRDTVTNLRLISINTDKKNNYGEPGGDGTREPISNAKINENHATLSNVSGLSEYNHVYLTSANSAEVKGNIATIEKSSINYLRPIRIVEIQSQTRPLPQGNLPAVGSDNVIVIENYITAIDVSTANLFAGILIEGAKNSGIAKNHISISGGEHNTVTGISASKGSSGGAGYEIYCNYLSVSNSKFTELHAVNESIGNSADGVIRNNQLVLSGNNVLLSKNIEKSIATVDSSSSNIGSTLAISGVLDVQNEKYNSSIYAGYSSYADVVEADLIVDGASINQKYSKKAIEMVAGRADHSSLNNQLIWRNGSQINGVDSLTNLSYLIGGTSSSGAADGNSVEIYASTWRADKFSMNISSDYDMVVNPKSQLSGSAIVGGWGVTEALNNSVILENSTIKARHIVGSIADSGNMSSEITVDNSTVEGTIQLFYSNESGIGSDSTLTVRGADTDLSKARILTTTSETIQTSNNRLVIDGWNGSVCGLGAVLSDGQLRTFDHLNFVNTKWENGGTLITSTAAAMHGNGTFTVINPNSISDGSLQFSQSPTMEVDESMTIIHADNGITYTDESVINTNKLIKGNAGTALEFDGTLTYGENDISYSVEKIEKATQTILVGDSRLAAAAFVNQGSDLLERVFHGFSLSRDKYGLMTFATAEGSKGNYDLSSPIKINAWNFLGGVRYVAPTNYGDLTSAVFVEYGDGNYRTTNSHLGLDFRTDGSVQYIGGGFAMRLMTPAQFYVEGSVRAGELRSDLDRALMDSNGSFFDTDTTSLYAGLHLGAGYIFQPAANLELDSYAKYFATYTDSDSFSIEQHNETYEFDGISSHRLRLGTRLSTKQNNMTFMFGIAGEYEFAGESDMVVAHAATHTSDLGEFSAFAEAGLSITPTASSPWQFDLQVRGWQGTREAITGMLTINYLL